MPLESFTKSPGFSQPVAAAVNLGTGLFGGLFGLMQQDKLNAFNAEQAQLNRDWQERMSNTAYQRAVADMLKAGLNPALMYGSGGPGASTPSGSTASAANTNAIADALAIQRSQAEIENIKSQTEKNLADADLTSRNAAWVDRLNQNQLDATASALKVNASTISLQEYDMALKEAERLRVLRDTAWIGRVNSAKTEADKARAARDYAETAILEWEKKHGHRMSQSTTLALADSIAAALGLNENEIKDTFDTIKWNFKRIPDNVNDAFNPFHGFVRSFRDYNSYDPLYGVPSWRRKSPNYWK